ncbi:MAG: hypothetical protein GX166_00725 [Clostridiaceae bacterium]|nr:hypothetical protein [Clostridiaceae bacterium]
MIRKFVVCILIFVMAFSSSLSFAEDAEDTYVIYDFTEPEIYWAGENESLDYFAYDDEELAYMGKLYNVNWAKRYGGVSIQGTDLTLNVSSTKKRYLKMIVRVDEIGAQNAFDNFVAYYWYDTDSKDPNSARYINLPKNCAQAISGAEEYITLVLDLGWANEEEKLVTQFRMDIFSSTMDKTAVPTDGARCGEIYIRYIGFFDTMEEAENYELVLPTEVPKTPTPEPSETEQPKQTETTKPAATSGKQQNNDKSGMESMIGIVIGGIVLLAAVAIILIIVLPKRRSGL